jgi:hypothetical protein
MSNSKKIIISVCIAFTGLAPCWVAMTMPVTPDWLNKFLFICGLLLIIGDVFYLRDLFKGK